MQSLGSSDPVGDLGVSLGQSVHGADPVNALYFPATHAVQFRFGPDEPALQVQVVKDPLPTSVHSSSFSSRPRVLCVGRMSNRVCARVSVCVHIKKNVSRRNRGISEKEIKKTNICMLRNTSMHVSMMSAQGCVSDLCMCVCARMCWYYFANLSTVSVCLPVHTVTQKHAYTHKHQL